MYDMTILFAIGYHSLRFSHPLLCRHSNSPIKTEQHAEQQKEKKRERKKEKFKQAFKGERAYYNKTHTAIQKKAF